MKMSRISRKSKMAALLGVLAIASTGVFAPPPAQARPTCQEEASRQCRNPWTYEDKWQQQGYSSYQECLDDWISMLCPPHNYGPLEGVREEAL
jgi:hypothetical protein